MATNLAIDDSLIMEAQNLGGHLTKKATVSQALIEYIKRRKQLAVIGLFDSIEYDDDYNYKEQRRIL